MADGAPGDAGTSDCAREKTFRRAGSQGGRRRQAQPDPLSRLAEVDVSSPDSMPVCCTCAEGSRTTCIASPTFCFSVHVKSSDLEFSHFSALPTDRIINISKEIGALGSMICRIILLCNSCKASKGCERGARLLSREP